MTDPKYYGNYFGALKEPYTSPFETGELKIKTSFYIKYIKRFIDILISLIALFIVLPINMIMAVVTYFNVGSPIIFWQYRPGLGEKPFKMIKFRNMTNETDENGILLPPNQRVTKVGKFFRKTSLDELLQFWLIFTGKMSIIGPRPLLMCYLPGYTLDQHRRHSVKPGLECPLAVYGSEDISWDERLKNDLWYVDNISFKTDLIMMWRLVKLVFNSRRAKTRSDKMDNYLYIEQENK